ncbi:tryptophan-rich sensory protein [Panacibacter sp. DH6]|uniref:Tryptophan-rich sensory protein n=1 Tax=Panacibacter microcysteis TaxID=2793269 RepID=A0A931GXR1_9BACT|nr:tryptophan-rich sensory protein [Panacibacter microcysteis]MBG9376379.1 tryptophan-rich sensory protein [Panacibacter microcysteis]
MTATILLSILLFYGILVVVNIPAPFVGLEFDSDNKPSLWYAPPGFVIPIVWFVLFTLLGIARYKLVSQQLPDYQWWLFVLAFLCAAYAYYTLGLAKLTHISALWFGLIGNIIVILFAVLVVVKLLPVSKTAALLTVPVILWTAYASLIVLGEMKQQRLI